MSNGNRHISRVLDRLYCLYADDVVRGKTFEDFFNDTENAFAEICRGLDNPHEIDEAFRLKIVNLLISTICMYYSSKGSYWPLNEDIWAKLDKWRQIHRET